jgi:deazaflavin-dependent oxidoreductase (nitroreductase family)
MSEQKPPKQPSGGAPAIPTDMRAFNRAIIKEFRANGGRLSGPLAGSRLLLLTTRGARSGQSRTAVVGFRPHGDRYLVIASDNGAASDPAWYRNLLADPVATVEVGAEKFDVRSTTAGPDERDELAAKIDYLERQQKLTDREIPIVILERAGT